MQKEEKLKDLKEKEAKYGRKLAETRLKIGKADSPMESAHPSGRFELEDEIMVLEETLTGIKSEIEALEKNSQ